MRPCFNTLILVQGVTLPQSKPPLGMLTPGEDSVRSDGYAGLYSPCLAPRTVNRTTHPRDSLP